VDENAFLEKVFHFDSERGTYRAGAAIVQCFDHRFQLAFSKFFKRAGIASPDQIQIAGGAKALASPVSEAAREFLIEQIRTSVRLHDTRRVILTLHSDCGAYGGLAEAFGGDAGLEAERQEAELRCAAERLHRALPALEISAYFAGFDGIWEVELDR